MKPAAVVALVASLIAGAVFLLRGVSPPQSTSEHAVDSAALQEPLANHSPTSAPAVRLSAPVASASSLVPPAATTGAAGERAPMSEAERNFEEGQFDRGERRVYDEVAPTLGLNAIENDELLSLLREQHMFYYQLARSGHGVDVEAVRAWEQGRREAVESLLGAERASGFADYESTIMGRHVVLDVVQTLERSGIPMSSAQRNSLTKAVIERHAYPPPMRFSGNSIGANMQTETAQMRLAGQQLLGIAQGILTPRQYDAYQEWQAFSQDASEAANNSAVEPPQPEKR